jgi:tetratricopeptide (TPR) repeat protein
MIRDPHPSGQADRAWTARRSCARLARVRIPRAEVAVAALAALVYLGTLDAGFLTYDDPHFVLTPEVVRAPSARTVLATLAAPIEGSYHPLHILSYAVDARLYGMEHPGGFHATNVLLFAVCASLTVRVARRWGLGPRAAALAGALFAVHPSHVESVAWVSERKDVLSGVLVLLALLAIDPKTARPPGRAFLLFLAALASKTTAVVLAPYLALEAWLEGRRDARTALRVAPFLALGAAWIAIEAHAQKSFGYVRPLERGGLVSQLRLVVWVLAWYPRRFLFPAPLTPHPALEPTEQLGLGDLEAALVLLGLGAAFIASALRSGRIARLLGWFFLALGPVSNVVPMTTHAQDRYLFLPSVAASCLCADLCVSLVRRVPRSQAWALVVVISGAIFACTRATTSYARAWRTDRDLWTWAIAAEPGNAFAHLGLAAALEQADDLDGASSEADAALSAGGGTLASSFRATIAERRGRPDDARRELEGSWRRLSVLPPDDGATLVRLTLAAGDTAAASSWVTILEREDATAGGTKLAEAYLAHARGQLDAAARAYRDAAEARTGLRPNAWLGLAQVERARGELSSAGRAIAKAEASGGPHLAVLLERAQLSIASGEFGRAEDNARAALVLESGSVEARHALGLALAGEGRLGEAAAVLEPLARENGGPWVLYDLARVRSRRGETDLARAALARAIAARPELRERAARDPLLATLSSD